MLTTSSRLTADLRRLCRRMGSQSEPIFVEVCARNDSGFADCFIDVHKQIQEFGGSIQYGWTLWERPGVFAEGEFHAVWHSPAGTLLDVARKPNGEKRILFSPDPTRVFTGRRLDNVRMPLGKEPRIKELIVAKERFHRLANKLCVNIPYGTPITFEGEVLTLHQRVVRLELELVHLCSARRA